MKILKINFVSQSSNASPHLIITHKTRQLIKQNLLHCHKSIPLLQQLVYCLQRRRHRRITVVMHQNNIILPDLADNLLRDTVYVF